MHALTPLPIGLYNTLANTVLLHVLSTLSHIKKIFMYKQFKKNIVVVCQCEIQKHF